MKRIIPLFLVACSAKVVSPEVQIERPNRNLARELAETVGNNHYEGTSAEFSLINGKFIYSDTEGMIDGKGQCFESFYDNNFNGDMDPYYDSLSLDGSFDACAEVYGEDLTRRVMDYVNHSSFDGTFPVNGFNEKELELVNSRYHMSLLSELNKNK